MKKKILIITVAVVALSYTCRFWMQFHHDEGQGWKSADGSQLRLARL